MFQSPWKYFHNTSLQHKVTNMAKKLQVAKQIDGTWAPSQKDPGGHVMHLHVDSIERLLREHAETYQSRVGGLLACESISHLELQADGNIKITIETK